MKKKEKIMIAFTVGILITGLNYLLYIQPAMAEAASDESEKSALEMQLATIHSEILAIGDDSGSLETLQAEFDSIVKESYQIHKSYDIHDVFVGIAGDTNVDIVALSIGGLTELKSGEELWSSFQDYVTAKVEGATELVAGDENGPVVEMPTETIMGDPVPVNENIDLPDEVVNHPELVLPAGLTVRVTVEATFKDALRFVDNVNAYNKVFQVLNFSSADLEDPAPLKYSFDVRVLQTLKVGDRN